MHTISTISLKFFQLLFLIVTVAFAQAGSAADEFEKVKLPGKEFTQMRELLSTAEKEGYLDLASRYSIFAVDDASFEAAGLEVNDMSSADMHAFLVKHVATGHPDFESEDKVMSVSSLPLDMADRSRHKLICFSYAGDDIFVMNGKLHEDYVKVSDNYYVYFVDRVLEAQQNCM